MSLTVQQIENYYERIANETKNLRAFRRHLVGALGQADMILAINIDAKLQDHAIIMRALQIEGQKKGARI